jgi:trimethylamine---corrinoid protein Co-methyltransferase
MLLGDEMVGYARALLDEVPVDDEALALAEIEAAGPGGNHLGTKMTRVRHRRFWRPVLIDQNTHDRWLAHGQDTLLARVRRRLRELLDAEPLFTLDGAAAAAVDQLASPDTPRKDHR